MITLIGILVGLLIFLTFTPLRFRRLDAALRLAEMYSLDTARALSELSPESLEYKLLAGGVRLQPTTFRLLLVATGLAAGVTTWSFLPGVPALILGGIAAYLPAAWLEERVKNRGREIDRILPVAVGRIAAGLLASSSIPEVLQKTGESLDLEGPNPLAAELILTAAELRSKERHQTFRSLAARSPSTSLANLAFLLEGYSESGGGKYTEALLQTSQRIQQILVARNRSVAKAADAFLSARIIPLVLLVVFLFLANDPLIRDSLQAIPVQIVIGVGIGMMTAGYQVMRSLVAEVV